MLDLFRRIFRSRTAEPDPRIELTDNGFVLLSATDGSELRRGVWRQVTRIQTYKVDLFTTDCICLLFEFQVGADPIQVSEEWHGFADFMVALGHQFPSMPQDWYLEVMKPAFAPNHRVLFERSQATAA